MKFIAIIPARYASTRFPGKPLAQINGLSMIRRVYERVSEVFEYCYVATDDKRIEQHMLECGANVVMTSEHHRSGTDRVREALDTIEQQLGVSFDVVVNVQGDEPFIATDQLLLLRDAFKGQDAERVDIATLIKPFGVGEDVFNANSPKVVVSSAGYALYFSRSVIPYLRGVDIDVWNQSDYVFYKHIGLYAYRSKVLREVADLSPSKLEIAESLEQLRWLENGYRIKTAVTNHTTHAIDTPEDLEHVCELIKSGDLK